MRELNSLDQLKEKLQEMFQFQNNDLNFGIFKIFKLKQVEIIKFINLELENIVKKELENITNNEEKANLLELELFLKGLNQEVLLNDIEGNYEKIEGFINIGGNGESEKLKNILINTRQGNIEGDLENKIYNYILSFFELYYSEGDFGYNSRSLDTYKVEYDENYNGSDVMFHWKHKGSYYIKTGNGFNSIKFLLEERKIEFSLETNKDSEGEKTSQNNNVDNEFKHYEFNRIERIGRNYFKVIFNLGKKSTPKEDIYKEIFSQILDVELDNNFLFNKSKKDGKEVFKPNFNSLGNNFGKIENGNIKGFNQLKVKKDDLIKKYDTNLEAKDKIKKTFDELDESNETENTFKILWSLDNKLNSFYIGNDSDFFIHKDLKGFLTQEKEKFIKNNILGDLGIILNLKIDNTSLVIAKTFNEITDELIIFLSSVEEFQKHIFEMKKKVLVNEYCITIDNIDEGLYKEIVYNTEQLEEWKNLGFIEDIKYIDIKYLKDNKTLNIDTKFFSQEFKDKLLQSIDNIEEKINGILINSENYQALNVLKNKYRGKVKFIYIDPPYNTGGDFHYKDSFKQSSWLSMMYDRLELSKDLMDKNGGLFCFIDENSKYILKPLLDNFLYFKQDFVWNYKTIKNMPGKVVKRQYDDIFLYSKSSEYETNYLHKPYGIKYFSEFFKEYIDDNSLELSVDEGYTSIYTDTFLEKYENKIKSTANFLNDLHNDYIGNTENNKYGNKYIEDYENFLWDKIKEKRNFFRRRDGYIQPLFKKGELLGNKLNAVIEEQTIVEKRDEDTLLPNGQKPQRLIKKLFDISKYNKEDILLDYFAGSGTTCVVAHKMGRKYIGIEMGEYFESLLLPRMKKVLFGEQSGISNYEDINWKGGGIFKYQVLEQYEDVLDKLQNYNKETPEGLDLKYLYRKEEIELKTNLDLRKPFSNTYIYGRQQKLVNIDLIETYNYIKGYSIESIKTFTINSKYFKIIKIGNILQVWRDIEIGENDLESIKEIIAKFDDIDCLEINKELYSLERDKFGMLEINGNKIDVYIIEESLFNE